MKRLFLALAIAVTALVPAANAFAGTTASLTMTVEIPQSPLLAAVRGDCVFQVEAESRTADCVATILMAQPTLEERGWRLALVVDDVSSLSGGASLPGSAVSIQSIGQLATNRGQQVDQVGGPFLASDSLIGSYGSARTLVSARPGYGNGAYVTEVTFRLTVPEGLPAGSYAPNFTIEVSNNAI